MARGPKNRKNYLRLVGAGGPGQVPPPAGPTKPPAPACKLKAPAWLSKQAKAFWVQYVSPCGWLTAHDVPKAAMLAALYAELQSGSKKVSTTRLVVLRALLTDLALDPGARRRIVGKEPEAPTPAGGKYFS